MGIFGRQWNRVAEQPCDDAVSMNRAGCLSTIKAKEGLAPVTRQVVERGVFNLVRDMVALMSPAAVQDSQDHEIVGFDAIAIGAPFAQHPVWSPGRAVGAKAKMPAGL